MESLPEDAVAAPTGAHLDSNGDVESNSRASDAASESAPRAPRARPTAKAGKMRQIQESRRHMKATLMKGEIPTDRSGAPLVLPRGGIEWQKVRYSYAAREETQLTMEKGEWVLIVQKNNDGWWLGVRMREINEAVTRQMPLPRFLPASYLSRATAVTPAPVGELVRARSGSRKRRHGKEHKTLTASQYARLEMEAARRASSNKVGGGGDVKALDAIPSLTRTSKSAPSNLDAIPSLTRAHSSTRRKKKKPPPVSGVPADPGDRESRAVKMAQPPPMLDGAAREDVVEQMTLRKDEQFSNLLEALTGDAEGGSDTLARMQAEADEAAVEAQAQMDADAAAKIDTDAAAKAGADAKAKAEAEALAEAEAKAKAEAEAKAKAEAEAKAKAEAEAKAKAEAEAKAKAEAEAKVRAEAEAKAKAAAEVQAKLSTLERKERARERTEARRRKQAELRARREQREQEMRSKLELET